MFLPYKLVIAGENGRDSYFIKRANFCRREWRRFQCSWTFFILFWLGFVLAAPFLLLWIFGRDHKERSIMLALGAGLVVTFAVYA